MNQTTLQLLEFPKILEEIKTFALTETARQLLDQLKPSVNERQIQNWMDETTEARTMLGVNSSVPLPIMENIPEIMAKLGKGFVLAPQELESCGKLLEGVKRMVKYMEAMQTVAPRLASYAHSMFALDDLYDEITGAIVNQEVADRASSELYRIRRRMAVVEERIRQKLHDILRSDTYAHMLQDAIIQERNGRMVVPIQRQYRKKFSGTVVDTSSTGSTVFMEPAAVTRLQDEYSQLKSEEEAEVYRILTYLTGRVESYARELLINVETITHYDFVFAKAKYSQSLDMRPVQLNTSGVCDIKQGRHPLLGAKAVPLDFQIGQSHRALVITGPNTGGKTVTLKTVGLLTMMAQAGLHVPAEEGSEIAIFTDIIADIGDGQSMEQSLSTFSAHVRNILTMLTCADSRTLVLLDELGAGTDPAEGRGFAIAVLEQLFARGATIVATTHFGEIKEFARRTEGFVNGCMEFDPDSLQPLYKLKIGTWGDSHAFLIALKLGMDPALIDRAYEISYGKQMDFSLVSTEKLRDDTVIQEHQERVHAREEAEKNQARLERQRKYEKKELKVGDRVYISTMGRTGVVCEEENAKGDLVVLVLGKKYRINHKRLTLHIDREDLYPENYDLDIVLETKENRKKRKIMRKRHVEGVVIESRDDDILDPQ
ncbi:MAG TPA: DNA mismatch repair protein MutS [Syntrophomonadaceae bacterium]|nr:DNA mismatch repair protein MutS [Syntrophomonadaceae bacterium]HQE22894.1 DNA mismatch repair protein MutS [Syntrophomonadaceae bacterium]